MSKVETIFAAASGPAQFGAERALLKEDWWAIWLGSDRRGRFDPLANGGSWLVAVCRRNGPAFTQLSAHSPILAALCRQFCYEAPRFRALTALGHKAREFLPAFVFIMCSQSSLVIGHGIVPILRLRAPLSPSSSAL